MKKVLTAITLIAAASTAAFAQADNVAIGVQAGTSGLGLGVTYNLTETLNVRGNYNYLSYSRDETVDDINYDLELKLSNVELLLDWHVFGGGFRLSSGLVSNGNKLTGTGTARSDRTVEFGGEVFNASEIGRVDADVDFRSVAPYLGLGWGNVFNGGRLSLTADAGVLFQGSPSATVKAAPAANVNPAVAARLNQAVADEEASLEDELKAFKHYPIVRVGLAYRF